MESASEVEPGITGLKINVDLLQYHRDTASSIKSYQAVKIGC